MNFQQVLRVMKNKRVLTNTESSDAATALQVFSNRNLIVTDVNRLKQVVWIFTVAAMTPNRSRFGMLSQLLKKAAEIINTFGLKRFDHKEIVLAGIDKVFEGQGNMQIYLPIFELMNFEKHDFLGVLKPRSSRNGKPIRNYFDNLKFHYLKTLKESFLKLYPPSLQSAMLNLITYEYTNKVLNNPQTIFEAMDAFTLCKLPTKLQYWLTKNQTNIPARNINLNNLQNNNNNQNNPNNQYNVPNVPNIPNIPIGSGFRTPKQLANNSRKISNNYKRLRSDPGWNFN